MKVVDFSDGGDIIYSRTDIKGVKDLKGKTISLYGFDDFSYLFVLALLDKFGLKEEEV
ncbi:MAG: ABC transporter substrate-binding protein [Chloroflexi bacterium]|nr:ABC transporter substrate-binding protein [Chloroflexota bacterium]